MENTNLGVGPVLEACETAAAVIAALRATNRAVAVIDRGAYWRVSVPRRCVLTRAAIEQQLGRPFKLPCDLEQIMPAFSGRLTMDEHTAIWRTQDV